MLAACGRTGDLGRPLRHPADPAPFQRVGLHPDELFGEARFPLADDERELRARAWRFVARDEALPPFERIIERLRGGLADDRAVYDTHRYHARLVRPLSRSSASMWSRLVSDIDNDVDTLAPLAETAFRVADMDRLRARRLARSQGQEPSGGEAVLRRMANNRETILLAHDAARARLDAYEYALRRGGIALPDLREAEARTKLVGLRARIGWLGDVLTIYEATPVPGAQVASARR